jgi:hypothetical protein
MKYAYFIPDASGQVEVEVKCNCGNCCLGRQGEEGLRVRHILPPPASREVITLVCDCGMRFKPCLFGAQYCVSECEDIYEPHNWNAYSLRDYINAWTTATWIMEGARLKKKPFTDDDLCKIIWKSPVVTVTDRYKDEDPGSDILKAIRYHPEKIARLDTLARMANACTTIKEFKRLYNEVQRLLYGKEKALLFPEPEFSPEGLEVG